MGKGAPPLPQGAPEKAGKEEPPSPSCSFPSLRPGQSELPPRSLGRGSAGRSSFLVLPHLSTWTFFPHAPHPTESHSLCPSFSVASSRKPALLSLGLKWRLPTLLPAPGLAEHGGLEGAEAGVWQSASFPPRAKLIAFLPEAPGFSLPHGNQGQ